MAAIEVIRLTPAEFHADRIPAPGDPPVLVEGIEGEKGLEAIDMKIASRLAEDASGERLTPGSYEEPLLGIGLAMRGYRMASDEYDLPRLQLRRTAYQPFSRAVLGKGEILLTRSESPRKLEAAWEADLCFQGVGVVAKARANTKYSVSQPRGRPWVVTRSLSNGTFSIDPNDTYENWTVRNSINPRSPDN